MKLGSTDGETTATLKFKFYALLTVYMYSPNFKIWREPILWLRTKCDNFKYNWHNAKNSYHSQIFTMLCLLVFSFFSLLRLSVGFV